MGTNYYLHLNVCEKCGRPENVKHIGKSSAGWVFALHIYPDEGINELVDWIRLFENGDVYTSYGSKVDKEEMLSIITDRSWKRSEKIPMYYSSWNEFHRKNNSEFVQNGLLKSLSHQLGDGTYSLIDREFS